MEELVLTVVAITPPAGGYRRIVGRDRDGQGRGVNVAEAHLLSYAVRPGERWSFFMAADGETVLGGSIKVRDE